MNRVRTITANKLVLKDKAGKDRVWIDAANDSESTMICLFGKDRSAISMAIHADGHREIVIRDSYGRTAIAIGSKPAGQSGIDLYNAKGQPVITVTTDQGDKAIASFYGRVVTREVPPKRKSPHRTNGK